MKNENGWKRGVLWVGFFLMGSIQAEELAAGTPPISTSQLQRIGDEAAIMLRRVTLDFSTGSGRPLLFGMLDLVCSLSGASLQVSQIAGERTISRSKQENVTVGELLRRFCDEAHCTYRVIDGQILVVTEEESS